MGPAAIIAVPFDAGQEGLRMASGVAPLAAGLAPDAVRTVAPAGRWRAELATTFDLHRLVADAVRQAVTASRLPVVVAGDCSTSVGVVAGLAPLGRIGVLWLDAHGDFNTPETDGNGYLDGQGLAMLTGRCWSAHVASLLGRDVVADEDVLLVGARDLDAQEERALDGSGIGRLGVDACRSPDRDDALAVLFDQVDAVHLHLDVDVLDPSLGVANDYAAAGGLLPADVLDLVRAAVTRGPVVSLTIASWDRDRADGGSLPHVVPQLAADLVELLTGPPPRAVTDGA